MEHMDMPMDHGGKTQISPEKKPTMEDLMKMNPNMKM
jgi:hypothetical protein